MGGGGTYAGFAGSLSRRSSCARCFSTGVRAWRGGQVGLEEEVGVEVMLAIHNTRITFSFAFMPERSFSPELAENLPDYVPLSHDNPFLTAPVFDPEEFLLSRARTTLPELRTELRDYLLTLKEELVQLINNDYEAFISLSTDLRSEGSKLKSLRGPLGRLQSIILVCQIF